MSDKVKTIEDVRVGLTPEQYAEQEKVLIERIKEKKALLNDKDKASDGVYIRKHDYTKIQNYIESIRLIAEKMRTVEGDCIEQLARDIGTYLYNLARGDKDD